MQQHVAKCLNAIVLADSAEPDSPEKTLRMAFSGGLDSCVLLDILVQLNSGQRNSHPSFKLHAMHVHHGLSVHADEWAEFCANTCLSYDIPLNIVKVHVDKKAGLGIEAAARQARYDALMKKHADFDIDFIALAHHLNDQAETFLLQLFRGAGVKGLSAMAQVDISRRLFRPLVDVSRADLLAYAQQRRLKWIEDESNNDSHFDRNFLRHEIIPAIEQRFTSIATTLSRSASHMAEAAILLDELAAQDALICVQDTQLNLHQVASLTTIRAKNILRWWLVSRQQPLPTSARLQEMLSQLLGAKADAQVKVAIGGGHGAYLRRYQNMAYIETNAGLQLIEMIWKGEPELMLPDQSRLLFTKTKGSGLAARRLGIHTLRIAHRIGGERFKPDNNRPTRTLKHLLQEAGIPPWQRECLPLIYCDDTLAVVPTIGVASHLQAGKDEDGLLITWLP